MASRGDNTGAQGQYQGGYYTAPQGASDPRHPQGQDAYLQYGQPQGYAQQQGQMYTPQQPVYTEQQQMYTQQQPTYSQPQMYTQQQSMYTQQQQQPMYTQQQQPMYSQQQSQYSQPTPPQRQQQQGAADSFLPQILGAATGQSGQVGLMLGTQMLSAGQSYVAQQLMPGVVAPRYSTLKTYFDVSNTYVFRKLLLILFPFRNRNWRRAVVHDAAGQPAGTAAPREDVNAIDLYIPLMATITYVLLYGVVLGLRRQFRPEALGGTLSGATVFIACELALIKLAAYLLALGGGSGVRILDVLATIGYNFVPLTTTLLVEVLLGRRARMLAFAYTSAAMAFFMLRSLRYSFLPEASAADAPSAARRRRVYFLFGVVVVQILCSYFLLV